MHAVQLARRLPGFARLLWVVACVLVACAVTAPAAAANPGDLTFADCIGLLPDCGPVNPYNALVGARDIAVSQDGRQMYVASANGVSHLRIDSTGHPTVEGCAGNVTGCTPVSPDYMVYRSPQRLALTPDGQNLYVIADAIAHFSIGDGGNLVYDGCIGDIRGCALTDPNDPNIDVGGVSGLAMTPDGNILYVGLTWQSRIVRLVIGPGGNLSFGGCVGPGCAFDPGTLTDGVDSLAVTPDGKHLIATTGELGIVAPYTVNAFALDPAGNLAYNGCIGNDPRCVPVSPSAAIAAPHELLAAPGSRDVYLSAGNAVSHFRITGDGTLVFARCMGPAGCTATSPAGALDGAGIPAITSDGVNMYVPGGADSVVSHLEFDAAGNMIFVGCTGELSGCSGTTVIHALDGADAAAVTGDGTHLYVGGSSGNDVSQFNIAGFAAGGTR